MSKAGIEGLDVESFAPDAVDPLLAASALAADYPGAETGRWIAHDFGFTPARRYAGSSSCTTPPVGARSANPYVVLHGTGGSAKSATPGFAGELFGPGQASTPRSTHHHCRRARPWRRQKPSDGLRRIPALRLRRYGGGEYRLRAKGWASTTLGCSSATRWAACTAWAVGRRIPDYMDALVPMASQPTAMASRNWMLRRMWSRSSAAMPTTTTATTRRSRAR